jgi:hypothetical protein
MKYVKFLLHVQHLLQVLGFYDSCSPFFQRYVTAINLLLMKKQCTLTAVLAVLQDYMKVSGINADHRIKGGRKHVFVQHELGENWSLFTKELLKLIFENLAKVTAEVNVTPKRP